MFFILCTNPSVAHTDTGRAGWIEWESDESLPTASGRYYLSQDVNLTRFWYVPDGVTDLCLNGHVIKQSSQTGVIMIQGANTELNIYDCDTTSKHFFDEDDSGLWVLNDKNTGSNRFVESGVITGGYGNLGGGICVVGGALNMFGGNIVGCASGNTGGGVYVHSGEFTMYGGRIVGCISSDCGGGVYANNGKFTISKDAVIDENNDVAFKDKIYVTGPRFDGSVGYLDVDSFKEGDTVVQITSDSPVSAQDIAGEFGLKDYTKALVASPDDKRLVLAKVEIPKISAATLSLSTDIAVRFYVKESSLKGYSDPYIIAEFNGTEYPIIRPQEDAKNSRLMFVFRNISPSEMRIPIKATLFALKDGETVHREYDTVTYSIRDYCMNQIKNNDASSDLKTLCVNLLNYGSASQIYLGETDNTKLVNRTLSKEQKGRASPVIIPAPKDDKAVSCTGDDRVGVWRAASLSLYSDVSVICKFTTDINPSNLTGVVTYGQCGENKATVNEFYDSTYGANKTPCKYLKFNKMNALELNYPIEVVLKDKYSGEKSKTLTYSVDSYAYSKIPEGGDLSNLAVNLMKYIRSVEPMTSPGIMIQGFGTIFMEENSNEVKNITLANPKGNAGWYYLTFKLYLLDEDGNISELIYESPIVEPGKCINEITVSKTFEKGEYDAILFVQPYRIYDGTMTNNAELFVKIVVR